MLLLLVFSLCLAAPPASEIEALCSFYKNWPNKDWLVNEYTRGWNCSSGKPNPYPPDNADVCRWDGITCSPDGANVVKIQHIGDFYFRTKEETLSLTFTPCYFPTWELLKFPKLTFFEWKRWGNIPKLPAELGQMTTLKTLNLLELSDATAELPSLTRLTQLSDVVISRNIPGFTGQIFDKFSASQPHLKTMVVNGNRFNGTIPSHVGTWTNLEHWEFNSNQISGTLPTHVGRMKSLQYLIGNTNKLSGTLPTTIGQITTLRSLLLGANNFSMTIPTQFSALTQMTFLALYENQLNGTLPDFLGLRKMTACFLNSNQLSESASLSRLVYDISREGRVLDVSVNRFKTKHRPWIQPGNPNHPLLLWDPQDVNECVETPMICGENATCVDGWNPVLSYTCDCKRGYQWQQNPNKPDEFLCLDINECLTGAWSDLSNRISWLSGLSPSLSNKLNCTSQDQCINRVIKGTQKLPFECCPKGFTAKNGVCIDINECALRIDDCSSISLCVNTIGSFYCCPHGLRSNGTRCVDVDECAQKIDTCNTTEQCMNRNATHECCGEGWQAFRVDDQEWGDWCIDIDECQLSYDDCDQNQCINTNGSYYCCEKGFASSGTGTLSSTCIDVNECQINTHNCTSSDKCINTNGSFYCCSEDKTEHTDPSTNISSCWPCFDDYQLQDATSSDDSGSESLVGPSPDYFPSLSKLVPTYNFMYEKCLGTCDTGFFYRLRSKRHYLCVGGVLLLDLCSYPCANQTSLATAQSTTSAVFTQLQRKLVLGNVSKTFIQDIIDNLFPGHNISMSLTKKRSTTSPGFTISVIPCSNSNTSQQVQHVLNGLIKDIVPNIPSFAMYEIVPGTCTYEVSSSDPTPPSQLPLILGIILGVSAGLLIIGLSVAYYIYSQDNLDLSSLPDDLAWSFRHFMEHKRKWTKNGSDSNYFYSYEFPVNSKEFGKVKEFYDTFFEGKLLTVLSITGIVNPTLLINFLCTQKIMSERHQNSRDLFGSQTWRNGDDQQLRDWTYSTYQSTIKKCPWNIDMPLPIVPMLHGTDRVVADKIAETGFAALSSLDAGWFGKGIYFTTCAGYTVPYLHLSRNPAIIISLVLPGNAYPVTEHPKASDSLCGAALKSGYNSHFVATNINGYPHSKPSLSTEGVFTEFVIAQESQIVPAFILSIDKKTSVQLMKIWKRTVDQPESGEVTATF